MVGAADPLDVALAEGRRAERARLDVPLQPLGTAYDMGTAPDGTPLFDARIFSTREFQRNPYPYYRILQDHYPVFHDVQHNAYYVTRFEDVTACYFDEAGFNTIPKGSSSGVLGNTQLELSGIEHRRRRNIYGRHLIGKALDRRLFAIRELADELIERFAGPEPADFVHVDPATGRRTIELGQAFANEFPIRVVCQVLGIPDDAQDRFFWWYSAMMRGLGGSDTAHEGITARQDLEDYVTELVELRRREPGHLIDDGGEIIGLDIISELCRSEIDGAVMSTEEITSNIALIVGGGGETTRGAILNLWYLLLQHPEQFATVVADPDRFLQAFHEALRHSSSVGGQPRQNSHEITLHGVTIPAGSLIHMVDFAANHDERVFEEPERFDIDRVDLYWEKLLRSGYDSEGRRNHMAFGVGPHLCPGAWISQQETVVGSQVLAERITEVRIEAERMPTDIDGSLAPIGTGAIRELWISFEPITS
ncbi:MAG: cytochrome P450 [Actinomycetota bacterium]